MIEKIPTIWVFPSLNERLGFTSMISVRMIVFMALFLWFLAGHLSSGEVPFSELAGKVEASYYRPSGDLSYSQTVRFTMLTDRQHFRLRLEKPGENMATDYTEVAWDGTNSYYLSAMPTWVQKEREKGSRVGTNIATACITTIPVPQFEFADASCVLWCAYVAPSYLTRVSPMTPVYTPFLSGVKEGGDGAVYDFLKFAAVWRLHPPELDYLEEIWYVTQGSEKNQSRTAMSRVLTNAVFKTLQWTNTGWEQIPSSATAATFAKSPQGSRKVAEYNLTLDSHAVRSGPIVFQPVIPGLTVVTEERFNSAGRDLHFMYFATSNWLSLAAAKATQGYRQAAATATKLPKTESSPFRKVLFILLISAPIILVWRRGRLKKASV